MQIATVEGLKEFKAYRSDLRKALDQAVRKPRKFVYFKSFDFSDKARPLLLVGDCKTLLAALPGGKPLASGRCAEAGGRWIFEVAAGDMPAQKLREAVKDIGYDAELGQLTGKDSGDEGDGDESEDEDHGAPDTSAALRALQAQLAGISRELAAIESQAKNVPAFVAGYKAKCQEILQLLQAGDAAQAGPALAALRAALDKIMTKLTQTEKQLQEKRAQDIEATAGQVERAQGQLKKLAGSIATLDAQIEQQKKVVADLKTLPSGMKYAVYVAKKAAAEKVLVGFQATLAEKKIEATKLEAPAEELRELLKTFLVTSNKLQALRGDFAALPGDLPEGQAARDMVRVGQSESPGKIRDNATAGQAQRDIAASLREKTERSKAHGDMLKQRALSAKDLLARFKSLSDRVHDLTDKPLPAAVQAMISRYADGIKEAAGQPPGSPGLEETLDQLLQPVEDWLTAREKVVTEAERRDIAGKYSSYIAKPSNQHDPVMPRVKKRFDLLLSGMDEPPTSDLRECFVLLGAENPSEDLEGHNLREAEQAKAVAWGKTVFTSGLLQAIWKKTCESATTKGPAKSIEGYRLEDVEAAITIWESRAGEALGSVANMHVPGGARPQCKKGKNVTRPDIQANFISFWSGFEVDVHVCIRSCSAGSIDALKNADHPRINQLIQAGRITGSL